MDRIKRGKLKLRPRQTPLHMLQRIVFDPKMQRQLSIFCNPSKAMELRAEAAKRIYSGLSGH